MENIIGFPVEGKNFLKTRLPLVDSLRAYMSRGQSVLIDTPRRSGKTSIVKEFMRQEEALSKKDYTIVYFELEGHDTARQFCQEWFKQLLKFRSSKAIIEFLKDKGSNIWNTLSTMIKKFKIPEFELEFGSITRDLNLEQWKEKIETLLKGLKENDSKVVFVFDEFPDMLLKIQEKHGRKKNDFLAEADSLLSWLRTLRQKSGDCNYSFIFCGSVNFRTTLDEIGLRHRINDLEPFAVPLMKEAESRELLLSLTEPLEIQLQDDAIDYILPLITSGYPYYGQIIVKAMQSSNEKEFTRERAAAIIETMLRGEDHDLKHFHSRLEKRLSRKQRVIGGQLLKCLCNADPISEKVIYDVHITEKCEYAEFSTIVNRLIHEGYLMRDPDIVGALRFVSPLLRAWWEFKEGLR